MPQRSETDINNINNVVPQINSHSQVDVKSFDNIKIQSLTATDLAK